ncbi:MAG TPA: Uma2 family endonuclease [Isosphaeraceae bacterium]|nr:Uma2 family endonuclease [Isosphaeraceae bacterium]
MASAAPARLMTALEFMEADLGDGTFELVKGEVVRMAPPSPEHGRVCINVGFVLESFGRQSGLGYAVADSAVLTRRDPDTVRGPDVCFYSQSRLPRSELGTGIPPVPPDLAVEVYSPGNRQWEVQAKVSEYLEIGVALIWVVYPRSRSVAMYRQADELPVVLKEDQVIDNLPELPGFRCPVADLFQ